MESSQRELSTLRPPATAEARRDSYIAPRSERPRGQSAASYLGSVASELWAQVKSDPYPLPNTKVTLRAFFSGLQNRFAQAAYRTLHDERDLLPRFQKLIRPNGICLSGLWKITADSPYTGCFAPGTELPMLARASVTLRETRAGEYRSFGLAGKLFPVPPGRHQQQVKTLNFFVIDDNGGTLTRSYLDSELVSEPSFSLNRSSLSNLPVFVAVTLTQRWADQHPERRQLYPLAESGVSDRTRVRSPAFMMVRGSRDAVRTGAADFRNELHYARSVGGLRFDVLVRDRKSEPWLPIGVLELDDDVVSDTCDHRLHFAHPRWRNDAP